MAVLSLGSNLLSLRAQRSLSAATEGVARVSERLASGQRINRSSDDAAGLAISSALDARSRVYGAGIRNGNDAISALNVADGALSVLSAMLDRMTELAEQASNGVYTSAQRRAMDREAQALQQEFVRIQSSTKFNGVSLVNNQATQVGIQLGVGSNSQVNVNLGISGTGDTSQTSSEFSSIGTGHGVSATGYPATYAMGDYDGDGNADLFSIDNSNQVWLQLSDGSTFSAAQQIGLAGFAAPTGVATADVDGDGLADFVIAVGPEVHVFGSSTGQFSINVGAPLNAGVTPTFADYDGDGALDIFVASGNEVITLHNDGGGLSQTASTSVGGSDINSLSVSASGGNFSVMTSQVSGGQIKLINNFSYSGVVGNGYWVSSIADQDADGWTDTVVTTSNGVDLYNSNGSNIGNFGAGSVGKLISGDFNGDGNADVAVLDQWANQLSFWTGDGAGNFTYIGGNASIDGSGQVDNLTVGDLNNDGYDDVFAWDITTGQIQGWIQEGGETTTGSSTVALDSFSLLSAGSARNALDTIQSARDRIVTTQGAIGNSMTRVSVAINNLFASKENSEAASSRIKSADVALESANYARLQILQQSASAILSQANLTPRLILDLLRG